MLLKSLFIPALSILFISTAMAQGTWFPLTDVPNNNLHIEGGPVRALCKDAGGFTMLIGGSFDTLKSTSGVTSWYPIVYWNGSNFGTLIDCEPDQYKDVFSLASIVDPTNPSENWEAAGGSFGEDYATCFTMNYQYGQHNLIFWYGFTSFVQYLSSQGMSPMDTVFSIQMIPYPGCQFSGQGKFKTYIAAKHVFGNNSSDVKYVGYFDAYPSCNYSAITNFMQGGTDGPVYAINAIDSSNVYAGGLFDSAGTITANNIAKWNGLGWDSLRSGVNGKVKAIAYFNNKLYVGGSFTMAGGIPASNIAAWDGVQWSALGLGTTGPVNALVISNGNLYAGGSFTTAGSTVVNNVAKWDGFNWYSMAGGRNGEVYALEAFQGNIYAGGNFSGGQLDTAKWVAYFTDTVPGPLNVSTQTQHSFFSIFPNPSTGHFTLNCPNFTSCTVIVTNSLGEIVLQQGLSGPETTIGLSDQPPGLYAVTICSGYALSVQRLVLTR